MSSLSTNSVGMRNTRGKVKKETRKRVYLTTRKKLLWRPSVKTMEQSRKEYRKILANEAEKSATLKKHIKNSIRAVTHTMKPIRIPKLHFPREKYNSQPRHRCQPTTIRGQPYFASVFMEPGLTSERKRELRRCLDIQVPIYTGIDAVPMLSDGGYIYTIGLRHGDADKDITESDIFFQPVRSSLEFGAVHGIMVEREGIGTVLAAGEMQKTGNTIEFNMMSGTFMIGYKYESESTRIADIIFGSLRDKDMTVTFSNDGSSLIGRDVQEHELMNAKDCGYTVELFRVRDRCMLDYRYTAAKDKSPNEGKRFLETRRDRVGNITADNVTRMEGTNGKINITKRLYEPNAMY